MEGGTFLDTEIQKEFGRFVEIVLHTDGKDEKFGPSSQRNRALQQQRFATVALPFYALLDPTGSKVYWQKGGVVSEADFLAALKSVPTKGEKHASSNR